MYFLFFFPLSERYRVWIVGFCVEEGIGRRIGGLLHGRGSGLLSGLDWGVRQGDLSFFFHGI